MINYLPPETLRGLNCTQVKALWLIIPLILWHGKQSTSGAAYWNASQKQMAGKLGVSRTWLSTCLQQIHKKMLLTKIHRRREKGQWKTNLYKLGPEIVKIFKGTREAVASLLCHVKHSAHIVKNTVSSIKSEALEGVLRTPLNENNSVAQEYFNSLMKKYGPEEVS